MSVGALRHYGTRTGAGTIELAVSERVAANHGVTGGVWERHAAPLVEWAAKVRRMDRAERRREKQRRKREVPFSTLEIGPESAEKPLRYEDHEPVRPVPEDGCGRAALAFWFDVAGSLGSRARGTPGNTAPSGRKGGGE